MDSRRYGAGYRRHTGRRATAHELGNLCTFLPTEQVDTFELYYVKEPTSGVFSWSVNGGGATSINTVNASTIMGKSTITVALGRTRCRWIGFQLAA